MRFSCDSCGAQYMISDEKVGPGGVKVRCKKCGNVIPVRRAGAAPADVAPEAATARTEVDVDRDLEHAFQNVLGGGSIGGGAPEAPAAQPNAVADLASEWYVAIDDRQVGPIPPSGVRSRWEAGEIGPDTLAWRAGMSDWSPLASIPEMTRYLASGASAAKAAGASQARANVAVEGPTTAAAPVAATPSTVNGTNGKLNGHEGSWQPGAASALAALAARELTPATPEPLPGAAAPAPAAASSGTSLLDRLNLPEGGVDPTHLIPLPMKGVETTEVDLKPKATVEPERTEIRQIRKQAKRSGAALGIAVATVVAAAIGVGVWLFRPTPEQHPAPVAKAVQPPAAPQPAAAPSTPPADAQQVPPAPSAPSASAPSAAAAAPAAPPAVAAAVPAAPAQASPAPAPATPPAAEAHPEQPAAKTAAVQEPPAPAPAPAERASAHRPTRAEIAAAKKAARRERLAAAAAAAAAKPVPRPAAPEAAARPAPTPPPPATAVAPAKKGGDPLLDVGGDDDLEKELSSSKPRRSVYVPPAMGSDLPPNVSVSQINEAVVGQKSALLRCIEQQRAADPNARGTLKVRWIIGGDGAPRDVSILSDEFSKQPIGTCITGVVKGIRFPRSRTTGQEVVFPFKF